jgi:hypothetical protein
LIILADGCIFAYGTRVVLVLVEDSGRPRVLGRIPTHANIADQTARANVLTERVDIPADAFPKDSTCRVKRNAQVQPAVLTSLPEAE